MNTKESTTQKTKNELVPASTKTVERINPPSDFEGYSEELKTGLSAQANLLGQHAQRLTNLMHSEVEALENDYLNTEIDPNERTRHLSETQIDVVTRMGSQLIDTIRLGMQITGVRMKVEKGESP